jgi:hypothetical protein
MKRFAAAALVVATAGFGGLVVNMGGASAAIKPVDISCTNGGGQQPTGQQPSCTGGGLTQDSENQNPAGHAPAGHN